MSKFIRLLLVSLSIVLASWLKLLISSIKILLSVHSFFVIVFGSAYVVHFVVFISEPQANCSITKEIHDPTEVNSASPYYLYFPLLGFKYHNMVFIVSMGFIVCQQSLLAIESNVRWNRAWPTQ